MVTVQSISTSAEIVVISLWSQHIINLIVKALKAEGFSQLVSFGGMIEYNIKNYFDAIFVELCRPVRLREDIYGSALSAQFPHSYAPAWKHSWCLEKRS